MRGKAQAALGLALMLAQPAMIKRPVLEHNGTYHLGFSEQQNQT